jgi:predicted AAA+ superfamily ATPase
MEIQLSPVQQLAFDGLLAGMPLGNLFVLGGAAGTGKTTVLRHVHQTLGGTWLTMKDFIDALQPRHPLALEETFERWVMQALAAHDRVFLDDFDLIGNVTNRWGAYPRTGFLNVALATLVTHVLDTGKKLVLGCAGCVPALVGQRSFNYAIGSFKVADYESLCHAYLGPARASRLDYAKVYLFAPGLNAHQLKFVSVQFHGDDRLDTERFLDYLRLHHLTSNVDLEEVRPVSLQDLKGVDAVIRSLETNIILPLENDALAVELQSKPKRGVLLAGPPGTGKTTVGRALAHRLKSKFFLLDGTFVAGSCDFQGAVSHLFESAMRNAPAVLFIDDSDVLFGQGQEVGFYRYLLTMLDGLESESAGRVCVMMTAMAVHHLPAALLRSGRIELWLEMPLPDAAARRAILQQCLGPLPAALCEEVDLDELATATEGFTGADLSRLADDGKNLLAYDRVCGLPARRLTMYLRDAAEDLRGNKEKYARAEAAEWGRRSVRSV